MASAQGTGGSAQPASKGWLFNILAALGLITGAGALLVASLAGNNTWTGTNTFYDPTVFTNTIVIKSNITVLGASGGPSNVPMGGVTLHFVNGFYTGTSTP